jgi:iron(III) transport system substrate-binding protein
MRRLTAIVVVLCAIVAGALFVLWPRHRESLTLYSAVDYGSAVAHAFTAQTGVEVNVVNLSTGGLLAKVSAEGKRPAWALAWFDGDMAAAALDQAGLLERGAAPALPYTALGKSLAPADGAYTPTGLTLAGAFTYKPAELASPPAGWSDLLSPGLNGAVGMNNPAISGPTYPILAGMLSQAGGWPAGQSYVLALAHHGLHVYAKNANTLAAIGQGDIKVAVTQSGAAWYLAAKDPTLKVGIPSPSFALPSVIALAPGQSPERKALAQRFIRFVMSAKTQQLRMSQGKGDSYYWPLTMDVAAKSALPPLETLTVKTLDAADWGARESEINAWFSKAVASK